MAVYARMALDAGARIIGGCCGTSPAHLRAMRDALDTHGGGPVPELEQIVGALGAVSTGRAPSGAGRRIGWQVPRPAPTCKRGRGRRSGTSAD